MASKQVSKKVVLIGDGAVGKTSCIRKFVFDKFDDKYITTIGTKVTKKQLSLKAGGETTDLTLMLWDILGQKGYHSIQSKSYAGAAGAILVCDLTRRDTLQSIEDYWIPNFREVAGIVPMVLLANKVDLLYSLEFSSDEMQMLVLGSEEVEEVAVRYNMPTWRTSAKTGENVEEAFLTLAKTILGEPVGPVKKSTAAPAAAPAAPRPEKLSTGTRPSGVKPRPKAAVKPQPKAKAAAAGSSPLAQATEKIIDDFANQHPDGNAARQFVKEVFEMTEVDRANPTIKGMLTVIDRLAEDEAKRLGAKTSRKNKRNRMLIIKESIG